MTEPELSSFMNAIPLAALFVGADGRVAALNAQAGALLGPGAEGRHYITVLRQPSLLDAIEAVLNDGEARETRYLGKEAARETTYNVRCAPVAGASGQTGVMVCFNDITDLETAGQMRRDFVANVSHELRTPLTALLGFIETLRGAARDDPAARDRFLSIMEREASRMNRLVKDLLSLSRVESEERRRPTGELDVSALAASAAEGLGAMAGEYEVTLETALPEGELVIPGDADQLRQVLNNLIENAIKYGGRGGTVTVTVTRSGHDSRLRGPGVRIDVEDTGDGIADVHLARLTERFYRVDSGRSREMGGTGLGLAIVKHIVSRHRGRLRIHSEVGKGSRFSVILPAG